MFKINLYGADLFVRLEVVPDGYGTGPRTTRVEVHDESGPYSRLSVNLPDQPELPTTDHFWLKDWSENADLAQAIIRSGHIVLDESIPPVRSGYVMVSAYRVI